VTNGSGVREGSGEASGIGVGRGVREEITMGNWSFVVFARVGIRVGGDKGWAGDIGVDVDSTVQAASRTQNTKLRIRFIKNKYIYKKLSSDEFYSRFLQEFIICLVLCF
jgi:hypothetical protein